MTKKQFEDLVKSEGDYLKFFHLGFKCEIVRHKEFKHLNGYIFLTSDNDYFGVMYDEIDIPVHGGWTYCRRDVDFWVVGFDCAHFEDISSIFFTNEVNSEFSNSTYKDFSFVKSELEFACNDFSKKSKSYRRVSNLSKIFKDKCG